MKWGFPEIRGTLFRGPYNKDYNILGSILGSTYFGKLPNMSGCSTLPSALILVSSSPSHEPHHPLVLKVPRMCNGAYSLLGVGGSEFQGGDERLGTLPLNHTTWVHPHVLEPLRIPEAQMTAKA